MRNITQLGIGILLLTGGLIYAQSQDALFNLTATETRPVAGTMLLLLAGVFLWGAGRFIPHIRHKPPGIAWRASLRAVGWVGLVASTGLMLLLISETQAVGTIPWAEKSRIVELIIPLVMAAQAALIFSPDDEPALEVLLACPRRVSWILIERLLVLALVQSGIALVGTALSIHFVPGQDPLIMIVRWIPPTAFLTSIAVYTTIRSRVATFGATVTGLVWFVFAFFGNSLLPGGMTFWPLNYLLPFLWIINPYLQPSSLTLTDYGLNRICVLLLGANLIALSVYMLGDEERILLGTRKSSSSHGG